MLCRLSHRTRYAFGRPVFLEPHCLRLLPRTDAAQRLLSLTVALDPEPVGRSEQVDLSGNVVLSTWFSGLTDHLDVCVTATVETRRENPFDYLLEAGKNRLPVPLTPAERLVATACLAPVPAASARAHALADRLRGEGADTSQAFVLALLGWMSTNLVPISRETPGLLAPDALLVGGQGACRDLALCFLAACRHVGLPARFVSGYYEGDPELGDHDLHAWAEVWLPGGGWRGFDPAVGLAVADRHIAVAAAADPADTAPIVGTFRGEAPAAHLSHAIRLELVPNG